MPPAVGGSLIEISLNGRIFAPTADSDSNRKLGGFENEGLANGNGTARLKKIRVLPGISGLSIEIDDSLGDHEFLQASANLNEFWAVTATYAGGAVYAGSLQLMGEINPSSADTVLEINLMGELDLVQQ